jgi:hypothetical protein
MREYPSQARKRNHRGLITPFRQYRIGNKGK